MQRLGYAACGVLVLGLWLPWGTLSVGLLGSAPQELGTINGQDIGSDILDLPVGWIAAGAGIAGFLALARQARATALASGVVALLITGYTLLAIPGKETTTANGQDVSNLFNGQVGYAWGVFAVTAAAVALLVAAFRISQAEQATNVVEGDGGSGPPLSP